METRIKRSNGMKKKKKMMMITITKKRMLMMMMMTATRKMKKEEKKKKKKQQQQLNNNPEKSPIPNPNPNSSDWAGLPEPLLLLLFDRLTSIVDLLSSAAACHSWRSAAASSSSATSSPPLLLLPTPSPPHPRCRRLTPYPPPKFRLQTLTLFKSYPCMSPPKTLRHSCIGYSHSHLILLLFSSSPRHRHRHVILSDVFTGQELTSPAIFPSDPRPFRFSFGIATAPPSSPSCSVLLVAGYETSHSFQEDFSILCWRPGSSDWSELKLESSSEITSLIAFRGKVYGLDSLYRLIVIEFVPCFSWRPLPAQLSLVVYRSTHLVECDGELLMVLVVPVIEDSASLAARVEVYCLDLSRFVWVKKESLRDWCLFVDVVGNCAMARPNPGRWGGQSNCVYVACPGYDGWSVFPMDGKLIDTSDDSVISVTYLSYPRWPSPVWVYPSMLL